MFAIQQRGDISSHVTSRGAGLTNAQPQQQGYGGQTADGVVEADAVVLG